ncbi:MAG: hypothetical protein M0Z54_01405 [Thermaerobacter sp.]|nr:hypothetical protein [Thermaerobacter sp.]
MLGVARVVEAWDWHVAGQAVRVFRPGWVRGAECDEARRHRGVAEPWGFAGLVGVGLGPDGAPVFWDASGAVAESVSARVALAASQAWEEGVAPPDGLDVSLDAARRVPGALAPLYRVESAAGATLVLAAPESPVPLVFQQLDALCAVADQMRVQAGDTGTTAVLADLASRRVVGFRPHGECWRGPADVLAAALAAGRAEGRDLSGDWTGFTNLAVSVRAASDGQSAHLAVAAHLVALRRFYDVPDALSPFVLR